MSSHREAPEISKDPVADNADVYAFVSPDQPGHGHDHQQLRAAAGPGRRARTSTSSATTSSTRSTSTTTATPSRTSSTSSSSTRRCRTRTRSSTTRARSLAQRARTGTRASSTRSPASTRQGPEARERATAARHRPGVGKGTQFRPCSARTCRARRATSGRARCPTTTSLASAAIQTLPQARRCSAAAERPVLRRPGVDLRPRRTAAVQHLLT